MNGPLGDSDPALLRGIARARLLAGDGLGAVEAFEKLNQVDKPRSTPTSNSITRARWR